MVVILIVAILAAVAIPIMRGRVDAAKWSEGKAMMGTVATALRAYVAEVDKNIPNLAVLGSGDTPLFQNSLGFRNGDLDGTYFTQDNFQVLNGSYTADDNVLNFTIQGDRDEAASGIAEPDGYTLDQDGLFTAVDR
ncbi:MAG: type IV pilin protein, partial [Planctomycetota bacterium]|jgi:type II secretory pathway pseudopilin PulG